MLHFHTNVFARPSKTVLGLTVRLRGMEFATLAAPGGGPPVFDRPIPVLFDVIQQRLMQIPRMDIEPDGYFLVAGGEDQAERWQIDGHLFEYDYKMHRVEMHGSCSEAMLNQLLVCFGRWECEQVFQLVHEGVTFTDPDFRRWAEQPSD